jgi:hypothetical protein
MTARTTPVIDTTTNHDKDGKDSAGKDNDIKDNDGKDDSNDGNDGDGKDNDGKDNNGKGNAGNNNIDNDNNDIDDDNNIINDDNNDNYFGKDIHVGGTGGGAFVEIGEGFIPTTATMMSLTGMTTNMMTTTTSIRNN